MHRNKLVYPLGPTRHAQTQTPKPKGTYNFSIFNSPFPISNPSIRFWSSLLWFGFLFLFVPFNSHAAPVPLVTNGEPRCAIITAENPGDLVRLAAAELGNYIEKLSGAHPRQIADANLTSLSAGETVLLL